MQCGFANYTHVFLFTDDPSTAGVNLEEFLIFVTGASAIPLVGLDTIPIIDFTDSERLPDASTCSLTLTLKMNFQNFEAFCRTMKRSILDSHGYGTI